MIWWTFSTGVILPSLRHLSHSGCALRNGHGFFSMPVHTFCCCPPGVYIFDTAYSLFSYAHRSKRFFPLQALRNPDKHNLSSVFSASTQLAFGQNKSLAGFPARLVIL